MECRKLICIKAINETGNLSIQTRKWLVESKFNVWHFLNLARASGTQVKYSQLERPVCATAWCCATLPPHSMCGIGLHQGHAPCEKHLWENDTKTHRPVPPFPGCLFHLIVIHRKEQGRAGCWHGDGWLWAEAAAGDEWQPPRTESSWQTTQWAKLKMWGCSALWEPLTSSLISAVWGYWKSPFWEIQDVWRASAVPLLTAAISRDVSASHSMILSREVTSRLT